MPVIPQLYMRQHDVPNHEHSLIMLLKLTHLADRSDPSPQLVLPLSHFRSMKWDFAIQAAVEEVSSIAVHAHWTTSQPWVSICMVQDSQHKAETSIWTVSCKHYPYQSLCGKTQSDRPICLWTASDSLEPHLFDLSTRKFACRMALIETAMPSEAFVKDITSVSGELTLNAPGVGQFKVTRSMSCHSWEFPFILQQNPYVFYLYAWPTLKNVYRAYLARQNSFDESRFMHLLAIMSFSDHRWNFQYHHSGPSLLLPIL